MWFDRMSQRAGQAVFIARISAGEIGSSVIDTEDLLVGILYMDPTLVPRSGGQLTAQELLASFDQWRTVSPKLNTSQDIPVSDGLGRLFERSISLADEMGSDNVQLAHLLLSMMMDPECHAAIALRKAGSAPEAIRHIAIEPDAAEAQTADFRWHHGLQDLFPNSEM